MSKYQRLTDDPSSQTLSSLCDKHDILSKKRVYTDNYACYVEVIGAKALRQGKQNTYQVEQNNARQRHWLGRFRRRTQAVIERNIAFPYLIPAYPRLAR
ncbi:hypothetical protein FACS1894206_01910 [Deltaproteobacteria bacterium]|nr:hypothetical protein FACS1894206_01910 [Deltaproteobacteria bacterium]